MSVMNSNSDDIPLAEVFKQISVELVAVANTVNVVEETVSRLADDGTDNSRIMMRDLQSIDVISQSLRAIASFSLNLSQSIPGDWQIDVRPATEKVSLSDLVKRLSCVHHHVSWGKTKVVGDWELFD